MEALAFVKAVIMSSSRVVRVCTPTLYPTQAQVHCMPPARHITPSGWFDGLFRATRMRPE